MDFKETYDLLEKHIKRINKHWHLKISITSTEDYRVYVKNHVENTTILNYGASSMFEIFRKLMYFILQELDQHLDGIGA